MRTLETVREVLLPFADPVQLDGLVEVPTQCLYPSGKRVVVFVSGGGTGARVSDEAGALDELTTHNKIANDVQTRVIIPACQKWGVYHEKGKLYATSKGKSDLRAAIVRVANASSFAAQIGFERIKEHAGRSFKKELHFVLSDFFGEERVKAEVKIAGKSNRSYRFDRMIELSNVEKLLIDPVSPDANSVNSRAVAHLDVRELGNPNIYQRIVYDDNENWNASDLSLLQMASTTVPLSKMREDLRSYELHKVA